MYVADGLANFGYKVFMVFPIFHIIRCTLHSTPWKYQIDIPKCIIIRARILMQKHIFSMWDESKDASKFEGFSMKEVFLKKL